MSPLIRADRPDGPVMRTISASNPSSLKKPFCCANGKTIQWTTCCGTPTRIFSAAEAVPLARNNIIAAASTGGFIAHLRFEYERTDGIKGNDRSQGHLFQVALRCSSRLLRTVGQAEFPSAPCAYRGIRQRVSKLIEKDISGARLYKTFARKGAQYEEEPV